MAESVYSVKFIGEPFYEYEFETTCVKCNLSKSYDFTKMDEVRDLVKKSDILFFDDLDHDGKIAIDSLQVMENKEEQQQVIFEIILRLAGIKGKRVIEVPEQGFFWLLDDEATM